MRQCSLCDRTDKTHDIGVESNLCTACNAALAYWSGKTPRQMMKRTRQIESFQNRMEVLLGAVNVRSIAQRRRTG